MEFLRDRFEGAHCLAWVLHPSGAVETVASVGLPAEAVLRIEESRFLGNPYVDEAMRRSTGDGNHLVFEADDLMPLSRARQTSFFREICAPLSIDDGIGAFVFEGDRHVGHVVVTRSGARDRYGERERALMGGVVDILGASFARTRASRELRVLRGAFDLHAQARGSGLIVFDDRGGVLHAHGAGPTVLDAHGEHLVASVRGFAASPRSSAVSSTASVSGVLPPDAPGTRTSFEIVASLIEGRMRFLCLLERVADRSEPVSAIPADAGLTPRETDVVRLLAKGLDNRSIAEGLGIGVYTTKDHLKSIFKKLNVRSRAQAVALLHRTGRATG